MSHILIPDGEGHYHSRAFDLDRESHARIALGRHPVDPIARAMAVQETRRRFFARGAHGIGALALASLLGENALAAGVAPDKTFGGLPGLPHFAPKAKRCIYLHLVGAPQQMETYDYKPKMQDMFDKDLPDSIRQGQRLRVVVALEAR